MKRFVAIGAAVLVVAVVLVVAGVGGSGTETVPSSTVANAAAATSRTGFRIAIEARTTVPGADRAIPFTGSGAIDPVHKRGELTIDVSKVPGAALAGGDARIHEVLDGLVIYMRSPFFKGLPGGKSWIRFDLRRIQQQLGLDTSGGGLTSDPSQLVDQLRATSGRVERVGHDRVRGAATTHYRATVDLRRYANLVPPERRAVARRGIEQLIKLTGSSRFPEEVWIDSQRRIRRFHMSWTIRNPTAGRGRATIAMTEDLYDFGTPVRAEAPPRGDTLDITELARRRLQAPIQ